ncbi:MAG: hypothetical protein JXN60_08965, partial [Lentisphaerae bacterium]|nr:hypothetical protein [Lentisphaerota bacterium]
MTKFSSLSCLTQYVSSSFANFNIPIRPFHRKQYRRVISHLPVFITSVLALLCLLNLSKDVHAQIVVTNLNPINITATSATLRGELLSGGGTNVADATIYWGEVDGGTVPGAWANDEYVGNVTLGVFITNVTGLTQGITNYYRCFASNAYGTAWASDSISFLPMNPIF